MFCTTCGNEMGARASCPNCGTVRPGGAQGPTPAAPSAAPPPGPDPTLVSGVPTSYGPTDTGAPPPPPGRTDDPPPAEEPPRSGKGRKVLVGVIALVLLAAAGGVAFVLLGGDDDGQVATAAAEPDAAAAEAPTTEASTTTEATTTTTTLPATLPDLTGGTLAEAEALADDLGIRLVVVNVANEDEPSGTVLSQNPEPGDPFADRMTVNVARPPVRTYLADLEPVEGDHPGLDNQTIDTATYTHAVTFRACDWGRPETRSAGYDLSRRYTRFVTDLGVPDDSPTGTSVKFEVHGDGRLLGESTVGLGEAGQLDVDVSGVLRLTITLSGISCSDDGYGVFADPQLTSPPDPDDSAPTPATTEP